MCVCVSVCSDSVYQAQEDVVNGGIDIKNVHSCTLQSVYMQYMVVHVYLLTVYM